jgi:hypothetical protein
MATEVSAVEQRASQSMSQRINSCLSAMFALLSAGSVASAASGTPEELFKRGFDELSAKQYSAAETDFLAGLKSKNDAQAWYYLGESYRQDGKSGKAYEAYGKSLAVAPKSAVAASATKRRAEIDAGAGGPAQTGIQSEAKTTSSTSAPPAPAAPKPYGFDAYCEVKENQQIGDVLWEITYPVRVRGINGKMETDLEMVHVWGSHPGEKGTFARKGIFDSTIVFTPQTRTFYSGVWKLHPTSESGSGKFTIEDGELQIVDQGGPVNGVGLHNFQTEVNARVHTMLDSLSWTLEEDALTVKNSPCEIKVQTYYK